MNKIRISLTPEQRQKHIDQLLALDGMSHISENPNSAYCPISLTQTPAEIKDAVLSRQQILMKQILEPVGITAYDPSTAPYSPDTNLTSLPQEVYLVDSGKILGNRFFVGHNLTASTGFGVELEKAVKFIRLPMILMDKQIRISRMQPHRVIYLQYRHFEKQVLDFQKVFIELQKFEIGIGFDGDEPVLLGFQKSQEPINLEKHIYQSFPNLVYNYQGTRPTVQLSATNPDIFIENNLS